MKLTKKSLDDIAHLIFDGYITEDVFLADTYITLRSLKSDERQKLFARYRHLSKSYNFYLIIDLLSVATCSIGGVEIDSIKIKDFLYRSKATVSIFLYDKYSKLEERINESSKFLEYYVESSDSKYYWGLYKNTTRSSELDVIKKINQFQYYWIVVNSFKDTMEEEKREWSKIEYMTNSICAFLNPKEFRRLKSKMNISDSFTQDEKLKGKVKALELLEKTDESIEIYEDEKVNEDGTVEADQLVFDAVRKQEGETKEEYTKRVNELMRRTLFGEAVDEHDRAVRRYEMKLLKELLLKRRTKSEILKAIRKRKKFAKAENMNKAISEDGVFREKVNMLGSDDALEKIDQETKQAGYVHNNVSYVDIVREKAFMGLPKKIKQEVFDDAMQDPLDIKKETEKFLDSIKKKPQEAPPMETSKKDNEGDRQLENDSKEVEKEDLKLESSEKLDVDPEKFQESKNAAEKASKMNVKSMDRDLLRQKKLEKQQKARRFQTAIERRNQALQKSDDSDSMFFG